MTEVPKPLDWQQLKLGINKPEDGFKVVPAFQGRVLRALLPNEEAAVSAFVNGEAVDNWVTSQNLQTLQASIAAVDDDCVHEKHYELSDDVVQVWTGFVSRVRASTVFQENVKAEERRALEARGLTLPTQKPPTRKPSSTSSPVTTPWLKPRKPRVRRHKTE